MSSENPDLLVILGPTACGKTNLACSLAYKLKGEVISADSRQVYQHMSVGTGKDIEEYEIEGSKVPFHLIDIKDPGYKYNIAEFQIDFIDAMQGIHQRSSIPILCGGSGLYIETALKGNSYLGIPMDPERQKVLNEKPEEELKALFEQLSSEVKSHLVNKTKMRIIRAIIIDEHLKEHPEFQPIAIPDFKYTIIGLDIEREARRQKISDRLSYRMNNGLVEEVEWLLANHLTFEDLAYYGLEYKWIGLYLKKEISKKELFEGLRIAIFQFAKKQMTWFRRMERKGYQINWLNALMEKEEMLQKVISIYQK